ncbi:MAG: DUF2905 domain-containing protein [Ignavibacteria bacterium]|nr:DUF2905 domain-containing protein [Ignavibacteria bacterium]
MDNFHSFGKFLMIIGIVIFIAGIFLMFFNKIPFLGKLPGDFVIKKNNFTIYFPLITSIILSILLSILFYFFFKFKK